MATNFSKSPVGILRLNLKIEDSHSRAGNILIVIDSKTLWKKKWKSLLFFFPFGSVSNRFRWAMHQPWIVPPIWQFHNSPGLMSPSDTSNTCSSLPGVFFWSLEPTLTSISTRAAFSQWLMRIVHTPAPLLLRLLDSPGYKDTQFLCSPAGFRALLFSDSLVLFYW